MDWTEFIDDHPISLMSRMSEKERERYLEAYNKKSARLLIVMGIISVVIILFYLLIVKS